MKTKILFLSLLISVFMIVFCSGSTAAKKEKKMKEPKRNSDIKYINPEIPHVELPAYKGQRYEATVPDTLDIQERASLAVHGLTSTTDPESDYEIYWAALLNRNPVYMFHSWNDSCWAKYMDDLPLLRLASGSKLNMHVERRWFEVLLHMQGPDGLLYFPKIGKPWWPNQCYGPKPPGEHYTLVYTNGRLLGAMTIYYQLTGEELWKNAGKRVVDGLAELAVYEDDKAYFEWVQFGPGKQFKEADRSAVTHNFATWFAWTVQGLANYYKVTSYEPAKTLSSKLARWIISDSNHFDSEGRFLPEYPGSSMTHFHGHTMVLLALLDYSLITGDTSTVDFVHKSFEFARDHGNTTVGFFPETLSGHTAETCEVADMIALALKLSQAGAGDYWDDADRWIRNQFAEAQLLNGDWVDEMVKDLPVTQAGPYETTERVSQRIVGCFASQAAANDWVGRPPEGTQACCNGNGARTIYYIWENILNYKDGKLRINLLLNRVSLWADVDSYIPYEGRVDVKVKKACKLSVRIPEWVTPEQTRCQVNDLDRSLSWDGRYALVGEVKPEDVVTLTFPIFEQTDVVNIEGQDYTLIRKGNTVVHIDPPGKYCPYYQREKYRKNKVQWKKVQRFMADKLIEW